MRFIDLFAGLGGFHKALHELGHECVFASELDPVLRDTYKKNWGKDISIHGDIRKIVKDNIDLIPDHDILCAGFPCQPFSKAGKQLGREDDRGTLFDEIVKILEARKPKYFILENVRFIAKHNNEETWKAMKVEFDRLGYQVDHKDYSPHDFGIPQHRQRIFIVGSLGINAHDHFSFDKVDKYKKDIVELENFIEQNPVSAKELPKSNKDCIRLWQTLILTKWNELFEWLPVETMIYYSQEKYYNALLQSQHRDGTVDCQPFIDFMLDTIENAMFQYIDSDENKSGGINGGLFGGLNETEKAIIVLIKENAHIRVFEMAQKLLKPVRTIENNIRQLKQKGIISRIGSKKTGYWKIN